MMKDILCVEHLSKQFGTQKIIHDLSLCVPPHSVFGFLGQNGAGKTTTMKLVLGLLKPDAGNIKVCGENVIYGQTNTNRYIGYLPDVPEFYGYMTPFEYLSLCGEITGLSKKAIKNKSNELVTLVGLDKANKKISSFSRGMKQRLGIAQALLNEPRLLICDEPTSALDPIGRKEILDILLKVKDKTTVLFSTHILSDVERICDHAAVLHNGKLALSGTLEEIKSAHQSNGIQIEFSNCTEMEQFMMSPAILPFASKTDTNDLSVIIHTNNRYETERTILKVLYKEELLPLKLELLEPSLESLFMEVIR